MMRANLRWMGPPTAESRGDFLLAIVYNQIIGGCQTGGR